MGVCLVSQHNMEIRDSEEERKERMLLWEIVFSSAFPITCILMFILVSCSFVVAFASELREWKRECRESQMLEVKLKSRASSVGRMMLNWWCLCLSRSQP